MTRRARAVGAVFLLLVATVGGGLAVTNGVFVTGTVPVDAPDGPQVDVVVASESQLELGGPSGPNTVEVIHEDGEIVFSSDSPTSARIAASDINGTWTVVSEIDTSAADLAIDPADKPTVTVGGGIDSVEFRDPTVDDGTVDLRYNASSTTTITMRTARTSTTLLAVDPDDGSVLDQSMTDPSGNVSFALPSGDQDVLIRSPESPQLSGGSPSGGVEVSETPISLSIDVSDADFDRSHGDSLSVEFYDASTDSLIGSETLSSNGTANVSWDSAVGGSNSWYAVAEDEYGTSTNSTTYDFRAPGTLTVYDENSTEIIDDGNLEIRFYYGSEQGEIVERAAPNGTANMSGLPVDESFIVTASADGYIPRRIFVRSLSNSDEIYLLPESSNYVETVFELEDLTGEFLASNSVLRVERNINGSWKTVQGDFFGATGDWTAQLSFNKRHRLFIRNTETGEERYLGTFTPTESGIRTVQVSASDTIAVEDVRPTIAVSPSVGQLPAYPNASVGAQLQPRDEEIADWNLSIMYTNETTEELLVNRTGSGGFDISEELDLEGRAGGVVTIDIEFATADGRGNIRSFRFPVTEHWDNPFSLVAVLTSISTRLGAETGSGVLTMLSFVVSLGATTTAALKTRASGVTIGLVAVGSLAVCSIIGWIGYQIVFVAGVAWLSMFVIMGRRY